MKVLERIDGKCLSKDICTAAIGWAEKGVAIVGLWGVASGQCDCGRSECTSPGKHPIGSEFPHGHKSGTTDITKIRRFFRQFPNANLAIVPPPGIVVVDVDGEIGRESFRKAALPATATVQTGRGFHCYYRHESESAFDLRRPGIDIKTSNGYVAVPPSTHQSGIPYRHKDGHKQVEALTENQGSKKSKSVRIDLSGLSHRIPEGERDRTLASYAGTFRNWGFSRRQLQSVLLACNSVACKPPLEETQVLKIARSIGSYKSRQEDAFGTLSEVAEEDVQFLGKPYFILGAVTVLDGNPGQGKSTFVTAIVAAITTGKAPSFIPDLRSGNVLIFSAEDDPARVLKPRLLANGADTTRVRFQKSPFSLDDQGLELLRTEMSEYRPIFVVIDPLVAYLDSETDLNNAQETTRFMTSLDQIAREFNSSILLVRHLRKSEATDALHRGLGSIAVAARVRSALVLGRHPEDSDMRAVAQAKCSYAKEGDTILFEIDGNNGKAPVVRWRGTSDALTADNLLARPSTQQGRPSDEREDAKRFLKELLAKGPVRRTHIDRAAEARSITDITLRRASVELGIIKFKDGKLSMWKLP